MPATVVHFYQEAIGDAPVVRWLEQLRDRDAAAFAQCAAAIRRLSSDGFELRRPTADYLRDGIHELRAKRGRVQYRLLYFFYGRNVAIIAHSLTKEDVVPPADIERAIQRRLKYEKNPKKHTYSEARP